MRVFALKTLGAHSRLPYCSHISIQQLQIVRDAQCGNFAGERDRVGCEAANMTLFVCTKAILTSQARQALPKLEDAIQADLGV